MSHLLDNIFWHALTGPQAWAAAGADGARRYAAGFSPIVAFADAARPDLDALKPFCETGEHLYCAGWSAPVPAGWRVDAQTTMHKMLWGGQPAGADQADGARPIEAADLPQVLALAELTQPGPFGPRTVELGDYFGCFEGERLMAMAGERAFAGTLREVSAVCTHPDFQGRGLARRLMNGVIRRLLERGETPCLHVMHDNERAHRLYLRMGFRDVSEVVVRVVSRTD